MLMNFMSQTCHVVSICCLFTVAEVSIPFRKSHVLEVVLLPGYWNLGVVLKTLNCWYTAQLRPRGVLLNLVVAGNFFFWSQSPGEVWHVCLLHPMVQRADTFPFCCVNPGSNADATERGPCCSCYTSVLCPESYLSRECLEIWVILSKLVVLLYESKEGFDAQLLTFYWSGSSCHQSEKCLGLKIDGK